MYHFIILVLIKLYEFNMAAHRVFTTHSSRNVWAMSIRICIEIKPWPLKLGILCTDLIEHLSINETCMKMSP